ESGGAREPGSPLLARLADVDLEAARAHWRAGDLAGSVASSREAIAFYRNAYGPDHPDEAYAWHNLGATLQDSGRPAEALPARAEAVRIRLARGDRTNALAVSLHGLGTALEDLGRYQESLAPLEEAARIQRARLGRADPARAQTLYGLGIAHMN